MNAGGGKGPNHTEYGHVTSSSSPTLLPSAKLTKHTRISYLTSLGCPLEDILNFKNFHSKQERKVQ
jgi:hypothetical protein